MCEANQEQFARTHGIPNRLAQHLKCTAEHLVAQHDGGRDTPTNIVAACLWCNRMRHHGRPHNAPDHVSYKSRVANLIAQGKWHPVITSNRMRHR